MATKKRKTRRKTTKKRKGPSLKTLKAMHAGLGRLIKRRGG
jgi:hypothetical protein